MAAAAPEVTRLVEAQLNFSTSLYKEIYESEANLVFCPTSIWAILAVLGFGAKGETAAQLVEAMKLSSLDSSSEVHDAFERVIGALTDANSPSIELIIATSMFIHVDFAVVEEFSTVIQKHYMAFSQQVDYQSDKEKACSDINDWVAAQTNDKIADLLSPDIFDESTRLVLVNAVYMKGLWAQQFDPTRTTPDAFMLLDDEVRLVDMMYQKGKYRYGKNEKHDSLILEMPYEGGQFSMYVILPQTTDAFRNLEASLDGETIAELLGSLGRSVSVFLWLPRFEADATLSLHEVLPKLGITNLFSEESADLTGICDQSDLVVSTILHKSLLKIDETGSEAAAATAAIARNKRSMEIAEEFHANRPFLYFIRHNQTGSILFMGRLTSPPPATTVKDEL